MGKLHELLAVEGDLKGARDKIRQETITTFQKKAHLFAGAMKKLTMHDENRKFEETTEYNELSETVPDKLKYMSSSVVRYLDTKVQKEIANQEAKADVIVDGQPLFEQLPVTFLLAMEDELKQLRKVYEAIPTLQAGIAWEPDKQKGEHVFVTANPIKTNKTEKNLRHDVVVQPTKEHPAQVKEWTEDKVIGTYETIAWSGMVSPAVKSALLGKIDILVQAFKKARQRANGQETKPMHIADQIFKFIHADI